MTSDEVLQVVGLSMLCEFVLKWMFYGESMTHSPWIGECCHRDVCNMLCA